MTKHKNMKTYLAHPLTCRAIQWDESKKTMEASGADCVRWSGHIERPDECKNAAISCIDGKKTLRPGDWIVEKDGVFSVMSDSAFHCNYQVDTVES